MCFLLPCAMFKTLICTLQVEDSSPPMKKPKRSSYKQTASRLTLDDNTNYVVIATICFVITFINYYILTFV